MAAIMNPPAILQRRPDGGPAIAVRPDRCERCKFWRMRETVLVPIVRGDCSRIVPPADAELETGAFLAVFELGATLVTPPAFSCSLFEKRVPKLTDEMIRAAELIAGFRHDRPWNGWLELFKSAPQSRIYSKHAVQSLRDDDTPDTRDRVHKAARLLEDFHGDNPE